jgi:hypothetical protein
MLEIFLRDSKAEILKGGMKAGVIKGKRTLWRPLTWIS